MNREVLFVNLPDAAALPTHAQLKTCAHGYAFRMTDNQEDAEIRIKTATSVDVLVCNDIVPSLLKAYHRKFPSGHVVIVSGMPIEPLWRLLETAGLGFINHVIANQFDADWAIHDLRITLQKILNGDYFGLEKYLGPSAHLHEQRVTLEDDRDVINRKVMEHAETCGASSYASRFVYGVCEELLMNALLDAPRAAQTHSGGAAPSSGKLREANLRYGYDGRWFAVSVSDPFGSFDRDKLFHYVKKVALPKDSRILIDTKEEGAGLGIYKILFSSHGFVCQVAPGKLTETIVLFDLHLKVRNFEKMARSIHFFDAV